MSISRREVLGLLGSATAIPVLADTHEHVRQLAADAPLAMRFEGETADEARLWQKRFGDQLTELLGPHRPPAYWETVTEAKVEFADHVRETLLLRAPGHADLPVHLLTPRGAAMARAGILALHGHGPFGHDAVAGVDDTLERAENIRSANYDYGRQLAREGYVVITPCFAPFGRRLGDAKAYRGQDACAVEFVRLQLLGRNLLTENLRDALWALEHLLRQPSVDAARIGCVGLSYGGRMTMMAAAVEPRIRAAVMSGALNVMQERIEGRYSCGAQVIPGLLRFGDVPEIAGLIAPRPALWEVGERDGLMVKDWVPKAWVRIEQVYEALDAGDKLEMDSFDGPHRWNGVRATPFLAEALGA